MRCSRSVIVRAGPGRLFRKASRSSFGIQHSIAEDRTVFRGPSHFFQTELS